MADLKTGSALNALNEKDYINKLYDTNNQAQKDLLKQNFKDNTGVLNQEQNRVQQQTQENVQRTQVEAKTAQEKYNGPKLSLGAQQQSALNRGNAQQSNVSSLNQRQRELDTEIDRQRKLLAFQYETAIKQARAENDMQKAQQLYTAAKDEEAKLLSLRQSANSILATKGDTSIRDALLKGETPTSDYSGTTWEQVLKNEASINKIYDKQLEAERLGLQAEHKKAMSNLEAQRQARQGETDKKLTNAYVEALQKAKNYAEVQNAYGQGSGTAGAARIAQDTELQKALTDIRLGQMEADAKTGIERFDIGQKYRDKLFASRKDTDKKRAKELLKAAEQEETTLYNLQLQLGQQLAQQNDYSVLGKLYGLTQDQIDRIQGTGKYAPVVSGGGGSSRSYGGNDSGDKYYGGRDGQKDWANPTLQAMANAGIAAYEANRTSSGSNASNKPTVVIGRTSSEKYIK